LNNISTNYLNLFSGWRCHWKSIFDGRKKEGYYL